MMTSTGEPGPAESIHFTSLASPLASPSIRVITDDAPGDAPSSRPATIIQPVSGLQSLGTVETLHGNVFGDPGRNEDLGDESQSYFPTIVEDDEFNDVEANPWRPRSESSSSSKSHVDWTGLDKTEQEARYEVSDESTAFLLARLEQENNALATDPRFPLKSRPRKQSRPPSMQVLRRLVQDPSNTRSSRYSVMNEPPPMTELEFWAALVRDYPQTAQRLPTLTANKIKAGVPAPLRGVVWVSMVGARDNFLEEQFDKLLLESSPYEVLIGKDIGRSFPGVEMFRDADGEGQQMLARVLKCFSLYDKEIGYCQGLGFLVGPLLMQMGDKDAFCVLVKLMENYNLRSCFLPDLSGLHLRIYQFKHLLDQHLPTLAAHLASLQVEAAYLTQWFLSFFAVTCPLPMLFRIYDVIFAEGASETIMRVALSLMKRNEERIMKSHEFEEVMHLLLSRSLWEPYGCDADDLVNDFAEMTGVVTKESLQTLEANFKLARANDPGAWYTFLPDATSAASRFLGRLWAAGTPIKSGGLSPGQAGGHSRTPSFLLRRSPSKQSLAASLNSTDISSESTTGTAATDITVTSRETSADMTPFASKTESVSISKGDRDLHGQIEDLLTALSDLQREQSLLTAQLQTEKEERGEDHQAFQALLKSLSSPENSDESLRDRRRTMQFSSAEQDVSSTSTEQKRKTMPDPPALDSESRTPVPELRDLIQRADDRMKLHQETRQKRSSYIFETKQILQESLARSREQLDIEQSKSAVLAQQLEEREQQVVKLNESLGEAQTRIRDQEREKENLEQTIQELIGMDDPGSPILSRADTGEGRLSITSLNRDDSGSVESLPTSPISELRIRSDSLLGKALANRQASNQMTGSSAFPPRGDSQVYSPPTTSPTGQAPGSSPFPQRGASLATQGILTNQKHTPASEDDLLVELVNVKTSEAAARQELEEVKAKFDAMRKLFGQESPSVSNGNGIFHRPSPSDSTVMGSSSAGGVFSSAASFFTSKSTNTNGMNNSSEGKVTPPALITPNTMASANSGSGLTGSFWGWGKKPASNTSVSTPAKERQESQELNGTQTVAGATDTA